MTRKDTPARTPDQEVIPQALGDILAERYLAYALSTITSRSLPDVRDGLKPVHRRLLYAMYLLRLSPDSGPKKSARVVGDVIGKFHPHGDQSIYDALVRLAQDFAVRFPLIDGQGNFGNIDGDGAAAMRYTEARLTSTAMRLLDGIDKDAVDMRMTYDGEAYEPIVLPAAFPNLLANGSSGIAVGMATNIPPHNAGEICKALLLLLDGDPTIDDLMKAMPGPDFPTGGLLVDPPEVIRQAYETGRGAMRVRARWEKEELKQGVYQIIVTEIPYQVQKSKLVEQIADLIVSKKLPLLEDVRDESAEDIRLVLIPKNRNVDAEVLMQALFRMSDLENRFSLNMNVLDMGRIPKVMSLKEVLRAFLNHRQEVLVRISTNRLNEVARRLEILEGYRIVYLNLDEVIRIIRESDEPKPELMAAFKLTEVQAEAILNMRLRSLRKLEEMEIRKEIDSLTQEQSALQELLASESKQWAQIRKDIVALGKAYDEGTELGRRRTTFEVAAAAQVIDLHEALIEKEPVTIVCSDKGWIRTLKGHNLKTDDIKYKDGDEQGFILEAQTTDKLMVAGSNGRFYTLPCDKLPSGRGFGEPLRLQIDLPQDADVVSLFTYQAGGKLLLANTQGRGFIVPTDDCIAQTKAGRIVMTLDAKDRLAFIEPVSAHHDHVAIIGRNRKFLIFRMDEVPVMGKGKGVILMRFKDGGISDMLTFTLANGLTISKGEKPRQKDDLQPWVLNRANSGKMPPNGFPRDNKFAPQRKIDPVAAEAAATPSA